MIFILQLIFALWNGYVIRWKLRNDTGASVTWHQIGVLNKSGLGLISFVGFVPVPYAAIINPFFLLSGWYGIALTVIFNLLFTYWIYNFIINWINNWSWRYLGEGKKGNMNYFGTFFVLILASLAITTMAIFDKLDLI
jgi:hypothetical protein